MTALAAGVLLARRVRQPTLRTVGIAAICLGSSLAWVALSPTGAVFLAAMPYFGFAVAFVVADTLEQATAAAAMVRVHYGPVRGAYDLHAAGPTAITSPSLGQLVCSAHETWARFCSSSSNN